MPPSDLGKKRAEELGLKESTRGHYSATDVHKLLRTGTEVFGYQTSEPTVSRFYQTKAWQMLNPDPELNALVIGVRPIHQDTAEGLLKMLTKIGAASYASDEVVELIRRAEKLLGIK